MVPSIEDLLADPQWMRHLARSLVADEGSADDVVQEASLLALTRARPENESLPSWLGALIRRAAFVHRRSDARRRKREQDMGPPRYAAAACEVAEHRELRRTLAEHALHLDEPYRTTVLLRYFVGLEPNEIARRESIPASTVRTRLQRALAMLRQRLDRQSRGDRSAWRASLMAVLLRRAPRPFPAKVAASLIAAAFVAVAGGTGFLFFSGSHRTPAPGGDLALAGSPRNKEDQERTVSEPEAIPTVAFVESAGSATLEVMVADPRGQPVPEARVLAYDAGREEITPFDGPGEDFFEALAGETGRARLQLPAGVPWLGVFVSAPGFSPWVKPGWRASDQIRVTLDRSLSLRGQVKAEDAAVVAGARVTWMGIADAVLFKRSAVTDAGGQFLIEGLRAEVCTAATGFRNQEWVEVLADGYAPFLASPLPPGHHGEINLDVTVRRGVEVRGRVLDLETSEPLKGARVLVWSYLLPPKVVTWGVRTLAKNPTGPWVLSETCTDAGGAFVLGHIPETESSSERGRYRDWRRRVGVLAKGHAPVSKELDDDLSPSASRSIDLSPPPAADLHGRVVDAGGQPVARAKVQLAAPIQDPAPWPVCAHRQDQSALTDAGGNYVFAAVGTSRKQPVTVRCGSRPLDALVHEIPQVACIVPPAGTVRAPDIKWPHWRTVRLRVVDENGRPVHGAEIRPTPYCLESPGRTEFALTTDREGRAPVRFGPWAEGAPQWRVVLAAWSDRTAISLFPPIRADDPPADELSVRLASGVALDGVAVEEDDSPVVGAQVWVRIHRPDHPELVPDSPLRTVAGPDALTTGFTGGDGRFVLTHLPADQPLDVGIRANGSDRPRDAVLRSVIAGAGPVTIRFPAR